MASRGTIGIYGVSSQSGAAYLAELLGEGLRVQAYARPTDHGRAVVESIQRQGGIRVERSPGSSKPLQQFVPLLESRVGHDLEELVDRSEVILFTHPSVYHEETARELAPILRRKRRRVPIILSPSRSMAAPYLWRILGPRYPLISFQTCPYACKVREPGSVLIKRRKQTWVACIEGAVSKQTLTLLRACYPQMIFSRMPAATSLGNIGAVFHPTAYLMNLPAIRQAEVEGRIYSFYQEGIVRNPLVGQMVEEVDQIRLRIARAVGCSVFGLRENPREEEWFRLMSRIDDPRRLKLYDGTDSPSRPIRSLRAMHDAVVSAQHWLHYTYGVKRIPGESLASAIGRTSNFQQNSCPQRRYADEDVATGLVPLEALARRLDIDCEPISRVIDLYSREIGTEARALGRNLQEFSLEELIQYLRGNVSCLAAVS